MQVLITAELSHMDASGAPIPHTMVVDNHLLAFDLTGVGTLVDQTIRRVTWGLQNDGAVLREGGCIVRQDGHHQLFWDKGPLRPYLDAFEAKRAELLKPDIAGNSAGAVLADILSGK